MVAAGIARPLVEHRQRKETQMTTDQLTAAEIDLLEWLSKEDFSQYGECHGKALDALIAKGLAQHHPGTGRNNSFIAKGDDIMFDKVSLTDAGWQLFKSRKARK